MSDTLPSAMDFAEWVEQNGATLEASRVISWYGTVGGKETMKWVWTAAYAHGGGNMTNVAEYGYGSDHGSAEASVGGLIYLPVVYKNRLFMPDLVVDDLTADSNTVTVLIRNAGTSATVEDFWVDVSIGPKTKPPRINQPWERIAAHGVVWGVIDSLPAGGSLTLVNDGGDPYYFPNLSSSPPLPLGESVYAYVDSVNFATTWGAVRESSESNNTRGTVSTAAEAQASPPVVAGSSPAVEGLPAR